LGQLAVGDLFDLTVEAPGWVEAVLRDVEAQPLSEEGAFLRIELARGLEVRGRVLFDVDGQPLSRVKVMHWSNTSMGGAGTILWERNRLSEMGTLREATTDAGGEFRLSGLSATAGTLFFEKRGFGRTLIVPFLPSEEPLEIRLARGAIFEGVVQEASGDPVAGARVAVRLGDLVLPEATAGSDGRYSIDDLPDGEASVEVSASGRLSCRETILLRAGERSVLDFTGAKGSILGRVTFRGEPLAGAEVTLAGRGKEGGARTTADAEGIFRFQNLAPGVHQIEADRAGVRRPFIAGARRKVEVTGGETRADLAIAGGIIAGRVVDRTTGRPVAGAEVQLQAYNQGHVEDLRFLSIFGRWAMAELRGLPAGDSRYRFEDLPRGKYFLMASRARGKPVSGWFGPLDLDPDRPPEELTLAVGGNGSVEVEIAGVPAPSLKQATWVRIRSAGGEPFGVSSAPDAEGRVVFRDIPDGRYRLEAESDRQFSTAEDLEVAGGPVARSLRLEPAAWIRLSLTGPGVEARAGTVVAIALEGDDPGWHQRAAEGNHPAEFGQKDPGTKDARYSFKTHPGRYRVRFEVRHRDSFISDPPLLTEEAEVILPPAGEAFVTLRIP
jgi:protocatechuate 3,4-dioxygenase beta subunit